MTVTIALAGDTMMGRCVADALRANGPAGLFAPPVVEAVRDADLFLLNLECCISGRGVPAGEFGYFFRAPPSAVDALAHLGVDCVTLANNHARDFGEEALLDTLQHLGAAGIRAVGAGADVEQARRPVELEARGVRLTVVAVTDHPARYAATTDRAGVAFADLAHGVPEWLIEAVRLSPPPVLVTPHWGPNMVADPVRHVRSAAHALIDAGAALVAGHSAHVFHGVEGRVLYDLGDFLDDYVTTETLRNDLGLLFFVTLDADGPVRLEALPLKLGFCHTSLAVGEDARWIGERFREACAELGTEATESNGRLVVDWPTRPPAPIPRTRPTSALRARRAGAARRGA